MGNKQSTDLKDKYMNNSYKHILEHKDFQLGKYSLFRYPDQKVLYLKKHINPSEFDDYTSDWNMFENKVFSKCQNLCELKFFVTNKQNPEIYDIVFEFGNYINTHLNNENIIWDFINDILKALLFLQHQNLYYPLLRKRYTVFVSESSSFKILSPYAFGSFMKEAITVFFNPNVSLLRKKEICGKNVNRNVKEFGIMVLALVHNVEDVVIYKNPGLIKEILGIVKKKFSVKLYDFLSFTIETRERMTFTDLEHYLMNYEKIKISQIQRISPGEQKSRINIVSRNLENMQVGHSPRKMEDKIRVNSNMTMTIKKPFSPALQQKTPMLSGDISSFGSGEIKKNGNNGYLEKQRAQEENRRFEENRQRQIQLQKQAQIEQQRQAQIAQQRQAQIEQQRQAEIEHQRQIEIQKQKQIQIEKQKQIQIQKQNQIEIQKQKNLPKKKENIFQKYAGKKIKRLVIKWITEENCSREFIEFEDGTLVEKESDGNKVQSIMDNYYKKNNVKKPDNYEREKAEREKQEILKNAEIQRNDLSSKIEQKQKNNEIKIQNSTKTENTQNSSQTKKAEVYDPSKILKEEEEMKYLVPRNDDFKYDINNGNNYLKEKIGFIISLNTGDGNKTKKILSSKIAVFKGCYEDLRGIVDFGNQINPSIYHHVE